jgi:hypothetical protein
MTDEQFRSLLVYLRKSIVLLGFVVGILLAFAWEWGRYARWNCLHLAQARLGDRDAASSDASRKRITPHVLQLSYHFHS